MNIFLMFGRRNVPDDGSGNGLESKLGDAMLMSDVLRFVGAIE